MKIKQNDIVKFIKCEPQVAGRVIEIRGDKNVLVKWADGTHDRASASPS